MHRSAERLDPHGGSDCPGSRTNQRASCDVDVSIAFRRGIGGGVTDMLIAFRRGIGRDVDVSVAFRRGIGGGVTDMPITFRRSVGRDVDVAVSDLSGKSVLQG
jgi:hypothetical protein